MKTLALSALAALLAVPASAQTMPIVIQLSAPDRAPAARAPLTMEQRIANAAEAACEGASRRSVRGQQLYRACVTEVSAELAARHLTGNEAVVASR